ncbi:hypothetical protein PR048_031950, partial [Dryococelus australis]
MWIFSVISDFLTRMNLSTNNLRRICFDGAPKVIFVHCSNHALDLALQEIGEKNSIICDVLVVVKDVSTFIVESTKRKTTYSN